MPPELESTEKYPRMTEKMGGRSEGIRGRGQVGGAGCLSVCVPLQEVGTSHPLFLLIFPLATGKREGKLNGKDEGQLNGKALTALH